MTKKIEKKPAPEPVEQEAPKQSDVAPAVQAAKVPSADAPKPGSAEEQAKEKKDAKKTQESVTGDEEYIVLRDCYGFLGARYRKGERVRFPKGQEGIPYHFHNAALPLPKGALEDKSRAINEKKVRRIAKPEFV